jgi:hypothetical protein
MSNQQTPGAAPPAVIRPSLATRYAYAAPLQEVFFYERIQINHFDELEYKILPYSIHGEM